MEHIRSTSFIAYSIVFGVVIQLLVINLVMAQSQNMSLPEDTNNSRAVWNMKDRTITLVDPTTNETKIIGSFAVNAGNVTTNETITTNTENATTNETITTNTENATTNANLTPEKTTINETLTTSKAGNATTNINLTDKFEALQGK